MIMEQECKDCRAEGRAGKKLAAPYPGPRCYRHYQARRKGLRAKKNEQSQRDRYGIEPEDYEALLAAQGGKCALCGRKIGVSRRAAIDHDHSCERCGGRGCRACSRGLVDGLCNK